MAPSSRVAITLEQCWHDVPGGTATSALESIRALQAHTSLDLVGVSARHRHEPAPSFRPSIPVRALPLPRPLLYEAWHRLRRPAVERATGPVDAIHVTGMAMPPKTAPMVVTVHDLAFVHDPAHFTRRGVRFFHRAIELARQDADVVICPSQATLDDCAANGFATDRLRLVPWGLDAEPASSDDVEAVRAAFALDHPYIFWNGTIEPRKNLTTLLDAFGRFSSSEGVEVDLVISGPEGWNDELAALEAKAGARVRRLGFVSTDQLRALHAGAIAFCFPSLREGFGLPVLEAMRQGTPVVTSRGTATAEVLGPDGEAGYLVDPLDAAAIAVALTRIAGDPDHARSLGDAAQRRSAQFTWGETAALLEQAYVDAMGRGR